MSFSPPLSRAAAAWDRLPTAATTTHLEYGCRSSMFVTDKKWAQDIVVFLLTQLEDQSESVTADLQPCGDEHVQRLRDVAITIHDDTRFTEDACAQLDVIIEHAYNQMVGVYKNAAAICWRRLYTDSSILHTMADFLCSDGVPSEESLLRTAVARLDRVIIIAGACGEGRLELTQHLIRAVQSHFPCTNFSGKELPHSVAARQTILPTTFLVSIPRLETPPSLSTFVVRLCKRPFILSAFIRDWPAMNEHPWRSLDYLRKITGPGRIVPIEVGSDYRSDDWTQQMMALDDFFDSIADFAHGNADGSPMLYLAQHSMFMQFPALRDDIVIPDYLYTSLPAPENYPLYHPPRNEEQIVLNAWLGPGGTVSPAHTDPFYNCYTQVVGRKTVWLAPPECTPFMYPYPPPGSGEGDPKKLEQPKNPAQNATSPSLSNTSQVDVFSHTAKEEFPLFAEHVVPQAMCVTLEAGDLLFFPPGWWHALRSEETSFSVSMWF